MTKKETEEVTGRFLSFTEEEQDRIDTILRELEYPVDNIGLKAFILDAVEEIELEEEPRNKKGFIEDHPEVIEKGIEILGGVASMIMKRARR
jgi:hypothetical protein